MHKIVLARTIGFYASVVLIVVAMTLSGCGGGSSSPATTGALSGNWQINLTQEFPRPQTSLSVSGFLSQSEDAVTGSVQVPPSTQNGKCAGIGSLTGTVNTQNVTLSINTGGTSINLSGTISADGKAMTGNYSGLSGGCYTTSTSGTWTASMIPPLNGTFTGTISNSSYMSLLTGITPSNPITVSGTLTQTGGAGSSNATLTGTINASGYPCFASASLSGTISGANVYLLVFGYNGQQIGTIGVPPGAPAAVVVAQPGTGTGTGSGLSLVGAGPGTSGLALGANSAGSSFGPCPPIQNIPYDQAAIEFSF